MSEEYSLVRDIVYDHNERMLNIKKYYPFFKLSEVSFSRYDIDMGYILMAVIRFFIEHNNFQEKMVNYNEYSDFIHQVLVRDFELRLSDDEEKELTGYIFDKIKNDGKPFSYDYFDPVTKTRKTVRTKIIDNKIIDDTVMYFITADAIEFYLDTKEIKDESNITVAQVLLEKMISTRNFKGGTDVVVRINNEVARLIARKNEILGILSYDVFQGVKAYEDFVSTGVKWFEDEQQLFRKNKELIEKALRAGEQDNRYFDAMDDIYHLETELNRAMRKHGELLTACTALKSKVDDVVEQAKYNRLRSSFDFRKMLTNIMDNGNPQMLDAFVKPLLDLKVNKTFSLRMIDNMLTYKPDGDESGEKLSENIYNEKFKFEDELEDERIIANFYIMLDILFEMFSIRDEFDLREYNDTFIDKCGEDAIKNSDYYSFIVHLCQKSEYVIEESEEKPDTFLEETIKNNAVEFKKKYSGLRFEIIFDNPEDIILIGENELVNIKFRKVVQ